MPAIGMLMHKRPLLALIASLVVLALIGAGVFAFLGPGSQASTRVVSISAGGEHTCALLSGGTVKCWGHNDSGQLGNGTSPSPPTLQEACETGPYCGGGTVLPRNTTLSSTPVAVSGLSGVSAISAGFDHTCALLSGGTVKCWGSGSSTPVAVSGLTGVTAISAGPNHNCALLSIGAVECWGSNMYGQLGDGSTAYSPTPVAVSGLVGVSAISVGFDSTCALQSGGTVKCWGWNGMGQLGDGSTTNSPTPVAVSGLVGVSAISAGHGHTCALLSSGTVECWGYNHNSQLGNGTTADSPAPVTVSGLSGVSAISGRSDHTCALLSGGTVKCWGDNYLGQLGNGNTKTDYSMPVAVSGLSGVGAISAGSAHTCALLSVGTVECWGWNVSGQLGDGTTTDSSTPVTVRGL
jgi:alpha-tubulin suppressor-like RCC1 family protein